MKRLLILLVILGLLIPSTALGMKIADLPALTTVASGDLLIVEDVSEAVVANKTKKATWEALVAAPGAIGGTTPAAGSFTDVTVSKTLKTTKGSDVASANAMTLGDGNFFDITGTTTINTIASKGIGTMVVLQFDGILQLTHSADLFLPTAANITTAAGDIAVFYEYASGDWRCASYTRAGGASASTALDNLASVAINESLVSDTQDTDSLGSTTKEWLNLYIGDAGKIYLGLGQDASIERSAANQMTITATAGVIISDDLGLTADRVTKGWFTDLEVTNAIAGSITGVAATATALATTRAIGGVNFDGTAAITPTTIVVADTEDATAYIGIWDSATGNLLPKTDEQLTYAADTGVLTASGFVGPLTGEASTVATITGLAPDTATTQATQASITTTANLVTVGALDSGSISSNFGAINNGASGISTTGTLHGAIEIIADDNSLSAAQCYGSLNKLNGAETTTLPAAVAGMNVLLYSDDATVKTIDPNGTDHIWLNGVDLTAGVTMQSPGAVGDFIVLVAFAANNWYSIGQSGTWIVTP